MEDTPTPESNVKSTIDAVTGLVQAVPVYQDVVQPAAKQVGQSLETVAKLVNIALAPIKAMVWGYEQIEGFITTRVAEKLKNVPEGNIITPPPEVAGPAIEALRFTGHIESVRELYANLLATAMDNETTDKAHPGYIEIIKNLTSDEASLLKIFISEPLHPLVDINARKKEESHLFNLYKNFNLFYKNENIKNKDLISSYLDNLCRLGLLEIPDDEYIVDEQVYDSLVNDSEMEKIKNYVLLELGMEIKFNNKLIKPTSFGNVFIENIVNDKV